MTEASKVRRAATIVSAVLGLVATGEAIRGAAVRADAPPGQYAASAGEVLDNRTGLRWQQTISAMSQTQANAIAYCAGLGGGWRLPTVFELSSIVDETRRDPAIDPSAFPSTPADWFWSSSSVAGSPSVGWAVSFVLGNASSYDVGVSYAGRARCVR